MRINFNEEEGWDRPLLLTQDLLTAALDRVFKEILDPHSKIGRTITEKERLMGWDIQVYAPARPKGSSLEGYKPSQLRLMCEAWEGKKRTWQWPFENIAHSKVLQIVEGRSNGASLMPHLLLAGDTPYWGGIRMEGLVVVCSAFKEATDLAVSIMTAEEIIQRAEVKWKSLEPEKRQVNFLHTI